MRSVMGIFKWHGRDQAKSGRPDSINKNASETEPIVSMAQALMPDEAEDDVEGQTLPGFGSSEGESAVRLIGVAGDDDEASARRAIENHLLDMVNQLIGSQSGNDGPEPEKPSPSNLPQSADDYPLDQIAPVGWAGSVAGGSSSDSQGAGAGPYDSGKNNQAAELAPAPEDEELNLLRRLILGREIDGLEEVYRKFNNSGQLARAVSRVVTEAIRIRVRQDSELVGVLKTTVDSIVRNSVRNNPSELANNLFPVMGPAIRRSISESIRGMLQEFSRTLEKSFSLTGLKWRLKSWRTGIKFSEVVMLETMEYQVEQVFVIHADSGTLIIHMVNENAPAEVKKDVKDPDQVAAMLTAIQQFVNDSFIRGALSTLEFGDRNIYVARAPQVYAACVVLGQAPPNLRVDLQTALELLVMECADDLDFFKNDTTPFDKARRHFNGLMVSRFKDETQRLPLRTKLIAVLLLAAILSPLGFWGYKHYQMAELEDRVRMTVTQPGLKLLEITPRLWERWSIVCLKDELAEMPEKALAAAGLPRERYQMEYIPYISQEHEIVLRRVRTLLAGKPEGVEDRLNPVSKILTLRGSAPIDWLMMVYGRLRSIPGLSKVDISDIIDPGNGVAASLDDRGVLYLKGRASIGWLESIREQAVMAPGITQVDLSGVVDDEDTVKIKDLAAAINGTVIFFLLNKDQPVAEDLAKLNQAVENLVELEKLAARMGLVVSLVIYGHTDSSGSANRNYDLSQERAKTLAALLYSRGAAIPISTFGLGADFASIALTEETRDRKAAAGQSSRKIELRVYVNQKGSALF